MFSGLKKKKKKKPLFLLETCQRFYLTLGFQLFHGRILTKIQACGYFYVPQQTAHNLIFEINFVSEKILAA